MKAKEPVKEPCRSQLYCQSRNLGLGTGRQDVMREEPDVQKQINYPISYRLMRGFALLHRGQFGE